MPIPVRRGRQRRDAIPEESTVSRVVVLNWVTMDGVMQGPGRLDEDTRGRFEHGGWGVSYADEVAMQAMGKHMTADGKGLLLGRRTYEELLSHWNSVPDSPWADPLNDAQKYVASTSTEPLRWPNSTLLTGDVPEAVAALKKEPGGDLNIMGSGVLIRSLLPHGLIDEFMLMITPVVLGAGGRLFDDVPRTPLRLVDSQMTSTGVIIATYQPT
jgi:dihydrofolate reductase